jgi:hypothetical protein
LPAAEHVFYADVHVGNQPRIDRRSVEAWEPEEHAARGLLPSNASGRVVAGDEFRRSREFGARRIGPVSEPATHSPSPTAEARRSFHTEPVGNCSAITSTSSPRRHEG